MRNTGQWAANARAVAGFVAVEGRLPKKNASDLDESRLFEWLLRQRQAMNALGTGREVRSNGVLVGGVVMVPERIVFLDENVPGWRGRGPITPWLDMAFATLSFVSERGRWPSLSADGQEGRLGRWLRTQRGAFLGQNSTVRWTSGRRKWLDTMLPGWSESKRGKVRPVHLPQVPDSVVESLSARFDDHDAVDLLRLPAGSGGSRGTPSLLRPVPAGEFASWLRSAEQAGVSMRDVARRAGVPVLVLRRLSNARQGAVVPHLAHSVRSAVVEVVADQRGRLTSSPG